jgi:hypothetical protein
VHPEVPECLVCLVVVVHHPASGSKADQLMGLEQWCKTLLAKTKKENVARFEVQFSLQKNEACEFVWGLQQRQAVATTLSELGSASRTGCATGRMESSQEFNCQVFSLGECQENSACVS